MLKEALFAAVLCAFPAFAATTYWYNGDYDGNDALLNEQGGTLGTSLTYDDFIVGPAGVTLTGLFSNDFLPTGITVTQAYWEIRSGVSVGNGGTLLASGTTASITNTDLGIADSTFELFNVESDIAPVTLSQGTYWLTFAPVLPTFDAYVATTSGANAIGSPAANDGDSFTNSSARGLNFVTGFSQIPTGGDVPGGVDFSEGLFTGSSAPEPSTGVLVGGAAILAGLFKSRAGNYWRTLSRRFGN
jgi:hypothetical protein